MFALFSYALGHSLVVSSTKDDLQLILDLGQDFGLIFLSSGLLIQDTMYQIGVHFLKSRFILLHCLFYHWHPGIIFFSPQFGRPLSPGFQNHELKRSKNRLPIPFSDIFVSDMFSCRCRLKPGLNVLPQKLQVIPVARSV